MIKGKKPYDPITTLPSSVNPRWQKSQDSYAPDLNSSEVVSNKDACGYNIIEFEDGESVKVTKPFLPGEKSKSGIGTKRYGSVLDYPSNSNYL